MAKKKKRKETVKNNFGYMKELKGIFLILISIIGICNFGIVGGFFQHFAAFFVGTSYIILLAILFIVGAYIMIKRDEPCLFTSKLIGLYVIILSLLVFCHLNYVKQLDLRGFDIFRETLNNLLGFINGANQIQGGGMIGALFSWAFVSLFTIEGTRVVCIALIICGTIMFTGMSIYEIIVSSKNKVKGVISKTHREPSSKLKIDLPNNDNDDEEEEEVTPKDKIVISSIDELKSHEESVSTTNNNNQKSEEEILVITPEEAMEAREYKFPSINLLNKPPKKNISVNKNIINENASILNNVFHDFSIDGHVVTAHIGPSVTQYEMEVKAGTKVSKILGLNREIALAMAAKDVRIQAPIPGKKTIGIEIPNPQTMMVSVREILEASKGKEDKKLLVTLGQNIMGSPEFCEINKTPHLLVAGSTGSGKSVCINSMIVSILMRTRPDEVKLVLVDPKKVELSMYNGVPHLLAPVVTDARKANIALKKIVVEMERRYEVFEASGTKNIEGYNKYVDKKNESSDSDNQLKRLPFIVVIIDELADLMLVAAKEVEDSIMRITQMARAAGIHLIVATQRPSTDVITGVVKANIPSRISFAVSSSIDSRTILDMVGAEKLLGKGDMLYLPQGENTPIRIQGTFISDDEIKAVVDYTISQQKARYDETLVMSDEEMNAKSSFDSPATHDSRDADEEPLYNEIVEFVVTQGKASASLLQRRFRLGYNRAARCIDLLEERGIIGPSNGSKPREVLVKLESNGEEE